MYADGLLLFFICIIPAAVTFILLPVYGMHIILLHGNFYLRCEPAMEAVTIPFIALPFTVPLSILREEGYGVGSFFPSPGIPLIELPEGSGQVKRTIIGITASINAFVRRIV